MPAVPIAHDRLSARRRVGRCEGGYRLSTAAASMKQAERTCRLCSKIGRDGNRNVRGTCTCGSERGRERNMARNGKSAGARVLSHSSSRRNGSFASARVLACQKPAQTNQIDYEKPSKLPKTAVPSRRSAPRPRFLPSPFPPSACDAAHDGFPVVSLAFWLPNPRNL
jgi:hypothetical protein